MGFPPQSSILTLRGQIADAGGLANPSRYTIYITPPRIFSTTAINATPGTFATATSLSAASGTNISPQQTAQFNAASTGQPATNFGVRPDYFQEMGLEQVDAQSRLKIMCSKANLPGKSFSSSDIRTYGATFKMPYMDTYTDLQCSFIIGRDMWERHFFDAWSYTIQDPGSHDFNYIDEYATTIECYQLDEQGLCTYACRLYRAWPIEIGEVTLGYDMRNTYHILPITFTYYEWVNLRVNASTPTSIQPANSNPTGFESTIYPPGN
jgi:hypothetical protein